MKKFNSFIYTLILFSVISCKKDIIEQTEGIAALNPTTIDANAGNWKTILLSSGADASLTIPAPLSITNPTYIAELNEIKGLQQNITKDQQKEITYWAAGGVLRWNEIMRELVAKYNLPPYQNEDGSYPIPQGANPFAYPLFPFSNPPYAARAYAYIAAAQYDALVVAWHYKKIYNRLAPYKNTTGINPMVIPTDLPSYPSEAAVLAGTTAEMMKLLFPTEIANIEQKAANQQLSMLRAGAATRSDMLAGEALGRAVAQKFIARARVDKAGASVGTPESWVQLETDCIARGEMPWKSLELPKRPPMLPGFGKVIPILMPAADLIALRPGPPPLTGSALMAKETQEVYDYVQKQDRENIRIAHFWADGVGTYTPPGHWNAIAADGFIAQNLSEVKWSRNMALLNLAMMDAAISCWDTKYFYFNARPCQVKSTIKTFTGVPNFPAYTSGHSTFSATASTVLGYLTPAKAADYTKMANEASLSRIVSGIHFRSDCDEGAKVGKKIGEYFIARGKTDGAQ